MNDFVIQGVTILGTEPEKGAQSLCAHRHSLFAFLWSCKSNFNYLLGNKKQ